MGAEDLEAVCSLAEVTLQATLTREDLAMELSRTFAKVFVLRPSSNEPVCAFLHFWHVEDEVHVLYLATDESARRRGYARCLMQSLFAYAREHRVRVIALEVRKSNGAAHALYEQLGFKTVQIRKRYYANDEDAIVMEHEFLWIKNNTFFGPA